ncbi:hypothetical protein V6N11_072080 [Hibiscus sabdariffa]|uniref:Uncharacterized protein n=1 Tax=Hibiscus sabdariffa TaxID=183260 RepID=A0ABR2U2S0_9ROSI
MKVNTNRGIRERVGLPGSAVLFVSGTESTDESIKATPSLSKRAGWEAVGETSMHSLVIGNGLLTNSSCDIQKDEVMVMEKFKTDATNDKESCGEIVNLPCFKLEYSNPITQVLVNMSMDWWLLGTNFMLIRCDPITLQYEGPATHNKIYGQRCGQWKTTTKFQGVFRTLQHYYSKVCIEVEKQRLGLNLCTENSIPSSKRLLFNGNIVFETNSSWDNSNTEQPDLWSVNRGALQGRTIGNVYTWIIKQLLNQLLGMEISNIFANVMVREFKDVDMNNKSNGVVKSNGNLRVSKDPKSDGYEVNECTAKISVIEKSHEKQELLGVKREKVEDHKFMDNKFSTDIPKEKRKKGEDHKFSTTASVWICANGITNVDSTLFPTFAREFSDSVMNERPQCAEGLIMALHMAREKCHSGRVEAGAARVKAGTSRIGAEGSLSASLWKLRKRQGEIRVFF